jgi:hypothetical protein
MSIVVRFTPTSLTAEKYDAASERIQNALNWPPDGLRAHICFGPKDNLRVSEVWESREQMEAFGQQLMPLLAEEGIQFSGEPEVLEVHHSEFMG